MYHSLGPLGLYIHWPFCQSKCPYCDFNSHVASRIDQDLWLKAYLAEIERVGYESRNRTLHTVFFGGGTPSLMNPEIVAAIIEKIRGTWPMANDPEITMEANPGSIEAGRFAAYRGAGVNRVSVGVQALNDLDLKKLGRMHSAKEAMAAFELAQSIFPRASFDLIYARQDQSLKDWEKELSVALSLRPTHLSLYQLTIEEGTVFYSRHASGHLKGLPDEDLSADMFELTQDVCVGHGLPPYEVSNHAIAGEESRHNKIYWHGADYLGIGPGAHGRITVDGKRYTTETPRLPMAWLEQIKDKGTGEIPRVELSMGEVASEYLMMGLRLYEGISLDRFRSISGGELDLHKIDHLTGDGLLVAESGRIRATRSGMLVLNALIANLLKG